jgi:23S rRNA (cytosine1962-C5)-methyltransferase
MSARVELRRDCLRPGTPLADTIRRDQISEIWGDITDDVAPVVSARGEVLAWGQVCRLGDDAVRIVSRGPKAPPADWVEERIVTALTFRRKMAFGPRTTGIVAIHGAGDGLPGIELDRYDDHAVLRLGTPNMLALRHRILDAIAPFELGRLLVEVTSQAALEHGGREEFVAIDGEALPQVLTHREDGLIFQTPCTASALKMGSHRTREARRKVSLLAQLAGGRVLELGTHVGGFSLHAAARGLPTFGVDLDAFSLHFAGQNSRANHLERTTWIRADYFEGLQRSDLQGHFGTVIWDPPTQNLNARELRTFLSKVGQVLPRMLNKVDNSGFFVACMRTHLIPDNLFDRCMIHAATCTDESQDEWSRVAAIEADLDVPRSLEAAHDDTPRAFVYRRLSRRI